MEVKSLSPSLHTYLIANNKQIWMYLKLFGFIEASDVVQFSITSTAIEVAATLQNKHDTWANLQIPVLNGHRTQVKRNFSAQILIN